MAEDHDTHANVNYTGIFIALCVCTLLSILADVVGKGMGKVILASLVLGIAAFKATFVILYFMHLKFEGPWKYVLLAPTTVLAMALPFTLAPDISFHYYTVQVPQSYEPQPATHGAYGVHGAVEEGAPAAPHGSEPHAPAPAKGH